MSNLKKWTKQILEIYLLPLINKKTDNQKQKLGLSCTILCYAKKANPQMAHLVFAKTQTYAEKPIELSFGQLNID